MNLLEYQAKKLLKKVGILVPKGDVLSDSRVNALQYPIVLKAQVPVGGRGKAGGIKIAKSELEAQKLAAEILKLSIKGHVAKTVLAEEVLQIKKEYYLGLTIDRASQSIVIIAHPDGGIDIEDADPKKLLSIPVTKNYSSAAKKISAIYKLPPSLNNDIQAIIEKLHSVFVKNDALLLEINPLVLTEQNKLVAADAKIILDNTAAFRHSSWKAFEAPASANFVVLNKQGSVAAMANGAGLAMATVDAIAASGLKPANFLDVGGGSSTESMLAAFRQITSLPEVKAIIVNIFAGITRCDEVANAIVEAKKQAEISPLFIRLYGTNQAKGESILTEAGITTLSSLEECIQEASHAVTK